MLDCFQVGAPHSLSALTKIGANNVTIDTTTATNQKSTKYSIFKPSSKLSN
ncbi:hypothetical protein VPHK469_0037 [Vibrio phage K469]